MGPKLTQNGQNEFLKYSQNWVQNGLKMAQTDSENILIFLAGKNCTSRCVSSTSYLKPVPNFPFSLKIGPKAYFWYQNWSQIGSKWPKWIPEIFSSFLQRKTVPVCWVSSTFSSFSHTLKLFPHCTFEPSTPFRIVSQVFYALGTFLGC